MGVLETVAGGVKKYCLLKLSTPRLSLAMLLRVTIRPWPRLSRNACLWSRGRENKGSLYERSRRRENWRLKNSCNNSNKKHSKLHRFVTKSVYYICSFVTPSGGWKDWKIRNMFSGIFSGQSTWSLLQQSSSLIGLTWKMWGDLLFSSILTCVCLQAEAEETELEQQQLHYQQTGISHTCKTRRFFFFF